MPGFCVECLDDYLDSSDEHIPALLLECHEFLSRSVAFVALPRTKAELAQLGKLLLANIRACAKHRLYAEIQTGAEVVQAAMNAIFYAFVQYSLDNSGSNTKGFFLRARSEHRSFGSYDGKWPRTPRDLLPHGEEASIRAYVRWASDPDQPAALTMLGMICTAIYPLVYPVLRSDKTLRQDLAKVLAHALDGFPPEQFFGVSALKVRPEFIQLMGAVAVLDAICRSPGASSRDK